MRALALAALVATVLQPADRPAVVLAGFASLPADTFAAGPPSGTFIKEGVRAAQPPFPSQPVQGFSSIAPDGDGWFWALTDNGFGAKLNSPDYLLRIYRVRPAWGEKRVELADRFVQLSDPDRKVPFLIVNEDTPERFLTGGDFDPESMVRMADGTFWIGDEFGPFLLHVDAGGRLLAPPFEAPGIRSPDNPLVATPDAGEPGKATVGRSRGFEGLAFDAERGTLLALLEAGLLQDEGKQTRVLEFDPATKAFTGRAWTIPLEQPGHALTELVPLTTRSDPPPFRSRDAVVWGAAGGRGFLTIERDNGHGASAKFKRVYAVYLSDRHPVADKPARGHRHLLPVDLLDIADPDGLGPAPSKRFSFPFVTTEAIWPDWPDLILVNDNNYPAGDGRVAGRRDNTEFIRLRLPVARP